MEKGYPPVPQDPEEPPCLVDVPDTQDIPGASVSPWKIVLVALFGIFGPFVLFSLLFFKFAPSWFSLTFASHSSSHGLKPYAGPSPVGPEIMFTATASVGKFGKVAQAFAPGPVEVRLMDAYTPLPSPRSSSFFTNILAGARVVDL
ncbi:hypothetical protein C8Q79DRAFT_1123023 [Trametes meyenii]|nr:hypothetical protein C8Q79DRAFT_1123023 [Trametes meyenii]